jgi:hypothetical protein
MSKHLNIELFQYNIIAEVQLYDSLIQGNVRGREADHSPPINAEVKKMWIYTSIPPYVFMA